MKLTRLELHRLTAVEEAVFDFASGVNVVIGENGTGKSHVLKLAYCLNESVRRYESDEGLDASPRELDEILTEMLVSVFQPDELGRLVRRGVAWASWSRRSTSSSASAWRSSSSCPR